MTSLRSLSLLPLAAFVIGCDAPVVLEWSNVSPTPGCFFLSGPHGTGSEYQLGDRGTLDVEGSTVTLTMGDAQFTGPREGRHFSLSRRVQCEPFPGFAFQFKETIVGEAGAHSSQASYAYEECQLLEDGTCEPGFCAMQADLSVRLAKHNEPDFAPPANFCSELCAFRDGIAAELSCGNDGCVELCELDLASKCVREVVTLGACELQQNASAYECFGVPVPQIGVCEAETNAFFACLFAGEPSGTCTVLE
jgi:hypothetical protein